MKMTFKNINSIVLSATFLFSNPLFAARGEDTTTTTVPVTSTTKTEGSTATTGKTTAEKSSGTASVQNAASKSSKSNTTGMVLGIGAAAFCAYKAIATCNNPATAGMCKLYIAGVAASMYVVGTMKKSKSKSAQTCDGVSTSACTVGAADENVASSTDTNGTNTGGGSTNYDPTKSAEYAKLEAQVKSIEASTGSKIDRTTGKVTFSDGSSLDTSNLSSGSLSNAGIDPAAFKSTMSEAQKAGEELVAKGVDSNSMFGDSLGGGGGGGGSAGSYETSSGASAISKNGTGLDRDPAQVSGMAVNYNGESIGVGPDNLFKMIHRRYDLHKTKGNFIGDAK